MGSDSGAPCHWRQARWRAVRRTRYALALVEAAAAAAAAATTTKSMDDAGGRRLYTAYNESRATCNSDAGSSGTGRTTLVLVGNDRGELECVALGDLLTALRRQQRHVDGAVATVPLLRACRPHRAPAPPTPSKRARREYVRSVDATARARDATERVFGAAVAALHGVHARRRGGGVAAQCAVVAGHADGTLSYYSDFVQRDVTSARRAVYGTGGNDGGRIDYGAAHRACRIYGIVRNVLGDDDDDDDDNDDDSDECVNGKRDSAGVATGTVPTEHVMVLADPCAYTFTIRAARAAATPRRAIVTAPTTATVPRELYAPTCGCVFVGGDLDPARTRAAIGTQHGTVTVVQRQTRGAGDGDNDNAAAAAAADDDDGHYDDNKNDDGDGDNFYTVRARIRIAETTAGVSAARGDDTGSAIGTLCWTPDGRFLLVGTPCTLSLYHVGGDDSARGAIRRASANRPLWTLTVPGRPAASTYCAHWRAFAVGSRNDNRVRFFDIGGRELAAARSSNACGVLALHFIERGAIVAATDDKDDGGVTRSAERALLLACGADGGVDVFVRPYSRALTIVGEGECDGGADPCASDVRARDA